MAYTDNISRLSRLTSILLKLQSRPWVRVEDLAEAFEVSTRTIYRDIQALERAGVPVVSVEGKGFSLMDGYAIPPVMFSESEANAIIIAEKIISQSKDESLIAEFRMAVDKIKSVLPGNEKEKADFLAQRTIIGKNWANDITSAYLKDIQHALTHFQVVEIAYQKPTSPGPAVRQVEPFAIYHNTSEHWVLIAWCRLRDDFRTFRVDRIRRLKILEEKFTPHSISLEEYVEIQRKKHLGTP